MDCYIKGCEYFTAHYLLLIEFLERYTNLHSKSAVNEFFSHINFTVLFCLIIVLLLNFFADLRLKMAPCFDLYFFEYW